MAVPLPDQPVTRWSCPNCDVQAVTRGLHPNRFHICAGLHMLTAPMIREGIRCKVEAAERDDYLGREIQNTGDDGRPYMSIRTTRDDGEDLCANAGLAQGSLRDAWAAGHGQTGFGE